ncbi:MAG: hypothetical protein EPO37_07885 [Nitrosarchaeum sp.]|nr:MAG: hypothetical protein EPO37_07885 [Nitrosarchaeum sp.]
MNEERAIAIMMANLKGSKKKSVNLLQFAEACRSLKNKWKGGFKEMSEFFHVSQFMLRQIDKINDLDKQFTPLLKEGKLGIDAAYQIWRLDKNRQKDFSKIVPYLTTEEIRAFVNILHKNPKKSVTECKKELDTIRDRNIHVLVLSLESEEFKKIKEHAIKKKQSVQDYVIDLIKNVKP